jgi:hypothetical protein
MAGKTRTAVFDLDAAEASRREQAGEPFRFSHGGQEFTIGGPKDWPVQVTDALSRGDMTAALDLLLGPTERERLYAAGPLTMGGIEALFTAISEWAGVGTLGN